MRARVCVCVCVAKPDVCVCVCVCVCVAKPGLRVLQTTCAYRFFWNLMSSVSSGLDLRQFLTLEDDLP